MKQYKVLLTNKTILVYGLERAKEYAQRQSIVCFRATVLDGDVKIARYENGKELFLA